jgi:1-phosphofructokinase family hexose kinase
MILCVIPNPAIDRTLHVEELRVGEVHRATRVLSAAGGKGINVARAVHTLGGDPFCLGLIGGHAGALLADLVAQEGLSAHWTRMKGETRTCVIVTQSDHDATLINEPGTEVSLEECSAFVADVEQFSTLAELICISGSLPPGFPLSLFESLLKRLTARGKSVWVDTSKQALKIALGVPGLNVKVNAAELGDALGVEISNAEQAMDAAGELRKAGLEQVVITLGKDGAIWTSAAGSWIASSPKVQPVSSIGSGDAFLGGLAVALTAGLPSETALRQAVAAGAANALTFGGGLFSRQDFQAIVQNTSSIIFPRHP